MYIASLSLLHFKNYRQAEFAFIDGINCFTGKNGTGKTNILDALYYLSFCKSFSNPSDIQNILLQQDFFFVQGKYHNQSSSDELNCSVKRGHKKIFRRNKKEYERLSDHIGLYPLVLIYPGDVNLILGGSDERRKFVDGVISQYNKEYLHKLLDYNKALQQRNALLKVFAEKRYVDESSLEIWDEQLITYGIFIYEERKRFFENFKNVFNENHKRLCNSVDDVDIQYESGLNEHSLSDLLKSSRKKDLAVQYTTEGIHKDNLNFFLKEKPLKKFGSQGQQKTYVIALKLAQYEFIKDIKKRKPILLFDDIFDKLDPERVELLIRMVSADGYGQVFITDTHKERLQQILEKLERGSRLFDIHDGEVLDITDYGLLS